MAGQIEMAHGYTRIHPLKISHFEHFFVSFIIPFCPAQIFFRAGEAAGDCLSYFERYIRSIEIHHEYQRLPQGVFDPVKTWTCLQLKPAACQGTDDNNPCQGFMET